MPDTKVLIVGGGIGGLSAAIALHARDIDCEIVEINQDWKVYHVGIVVQANFVRAMAALGVAEEAVAAGYPYQGVRICDPAGELLAEMPGLPIAGEGFPSDLGLTRPALHEVLSGAVLERRVPLRLGTTFTAVDDLGDRVAVEFSDGTRGKYDLVIAADGAYSEMRKVLFGDRYAPSYSGQGVWRYNIPRPPDLEWAVMHRGKTGGTVGYIPLNPETMYVFYVGEEPGNPFFPAQTLADELRRRLDGYGGYIPTIREQIVDPELVVYRPLETCVVDERWYRGRIALIGDACHSATPHLGQGAAMAVEDAVVLGEELARDLDVPAALERFWRRRYDRASFVAKSSIQLGEWEQRPDPEADPIALFAAVQKRVAEPI